MPRDSKDLPGKDGFSQRDREKLLDVIQHPEKYDVDVSDTKDGCSKKLFEWLLISAALINLLWRA